MPRNMDGQIKKADDLTEEFFNKGLTKTFDRRQTIIGYAQSQENLYFITSGTVKVVSYTDTGGEIIHYIYKPSEIFPNTRILGEKVYSLTFIAFTKTITKSRSINEFRALIAREPVILFKILLQQEGIFARIFNLNLGSAEQRLAHRLIGLAERLGRHEGEQRIIEVPLTIKELADSVRLSRETTGRIMKKFEQQGLIVAGRHHLVIYPEKLCAILEL